MKNNYFTIDPGISPTENMKDLVNPIFQKEISLDILRGKPPSYSDLRINEIQFAFVRKFGHAVYESKDIEYLQLSFYLHKRKHDYKKKSIKVENQKISTTYLRNVFNSLKAIKDIDEEAYLLAINIQREGQEKLDKIKVRDEIEYPGTNLYIHNTGFQLSFNALTENDVDYLMSCWHKIKTNVSLAK